MSEDTGLGSEESSSCECLTAVWLPQFKEDSLVQFLIMLSTRTSLMSSSAYIFLIIMFVADLVALLSLVQHHIPGARLVEESGREAVINLPQTAAKDSSLAIFLSELDQRLLELGISSYGLSDSTLEEVNKPKLIYNLRFTTIRLTRLTLV